MTKHAVVIAGGGPTGLMLAAELALAKVDVVVVERRTSQALESVRGGGLHARTIEVLDQRGVAERFLAAGKIMQVTSFLSVPLDLGDFPTRHSYGLALWQDAFERILAAWVLEELAVPILRGRAVTSFVQDDDGVDVALSDGGTLRARYLVGCDGGRSVIRKQAGIDFPGWAPSVSYLLAEGHVTDEPPWGIRRDDRGVHGIGKLEDGRVRIVSIEREVVQGEQPTIDELRAALVAVYGRDFGLHDPTWISRFTDATRHAARYREGRVLLAGDAAHVHSPAGGHGLNMGVQDAVNLGWKLALVANGRAPATLLDSYQAERHPVTARLLASTLATTAIGRGDDRTNELRATIGEMLAMDGPRKRYAGMMSGLDIHYELGPGHPLLGRRMPDLEVTTGQGPRRVFTWLHDARALLLELDDRDALDADAWSDRVQHVRARYTGAWELPVIGPVAAPRAVLVRPDGHVAWVGQGDDAGLVAALTTWLGSPDHGLAGAEGRT